MFGRRPMIVACFVGLLLGFGGPALGEPFDHVRIGDIDSFGFSDIPELTGVGGPADRDGNGRLNPGDTLPDLTPDGRISGTSGDLFDHRDAAESANSAVGAVGASDFGGSSGSHWTDVAVTDSWQTDPGGQPGFVFDFFVQDGDVAVGQDVFINVVLADLGRNIDVRYVRADSTAFNVPLQALTDPGTADDGFVQGAFVTVPFDDVFTAENDGFRGELEVDFLVQDDPYLAYDYAEISVNVIPEPSSLALLVLGATLFVRRRRRAEREMTGPDGCVRRHCVDMGMG